MLIVCGYINSALLIFKVQRMCKLDTRRKTGLAKTGPTGLLTIHVHIPIYLVASGRDHSIASDDDD